ncbi:MAG: type IX secretion system membrane protein PorP/SprF [Bacteroidota bacterium]
MKNRISHTLLIIYCRLTGKNSLLFISMLCFATGVYAQDPNFSQIDNIVQYSNIAAQTAENGYSVGLIQKRQWENLDGGFVTTLFTTGFNCKENWGMNLIGFEHAEGIEGIDASTGVFGKGSLTTLNLKLAFHYSLNLKNNPFFTFAFYPEYIHKSLKNSTLVFSDQINPLTGEITYINSSDLNYQKPTIVDIGMSAAFDLKAVPALSRGFLKNIKSFKLALSANHFPGIFSESVSSTNQAPANLPVYYSTLFLLEHVGPFNTYFKYYLDMDYQRYITSANFGINIFYNDITSSLKNNFFLIAGVKPMQKLSASQQDLFSYYVGTGLKLKTGLTITFVFEDAKFHNEPSRYSISTFETGLSYNFSDKCNCKRGIEKLKKKLSNLCPTF